MNVGVLWKEKYLDQLSIYQLFRKGDFAPWSEL
jgi:hypothetical protein